MNIIISRHRYTRYGVVGTLSINGSKVCDTTEHPNLYLLAGTYRVEIRKDKKLMRKVPFLCRQSDNAKTTQPSLRPGHGPFRYLDRSILVGSYYLDGVLLHSNGIFARLIDRLDKAQNRGEAISLTIV